MSYYSSPQEPQQFELFNSSDEPSSVKKGLFSKRISLAVEHLIIVCIVVLVLCVAVFSMGVERGKSAAVKTADDLEINLANSENDVIIAPSSGVTQPVRTGQMAASVRPVKAVPVTSAAFSNQEIEVDVPVPVAERVQEAVVSGVYTVQVASFKKDKFASQEVEILKKRGYEAFSVSKGGFYLVCVGKYKNKTSAEKTSRSLKSKYKDNLIRRL